MGLPVDIDGVRISPGDVLVGDHNGVVVVNRDDLDAVHGQIEAVRAAESEYVSDMGGEARTAEFVHMQVLANHMAAERARLETANARYEDWSAKTASSRETAGRAKAELHRRGIQPATAGPEQQSTLEW